MNGASAPGAAQKVCTVCGARFPADALFCPNDGLPLVSAGAAARGEAAVDPYLGEEISGHIEIRQLVGIGAMGRVYRAFQRGIDRDVAVKVLHRELSANAQLVSRFTREAKVASRLQHPNVVQVLLAGQLPDRALYMVMEFLDGLSLQSVLAASGGAIPLGRALHVVLQLCEAVGEAHAQGIVHRDLKPENVMLVRRGADDDFVKVLDFGIARITWSEQSVATAAGLIFGTARYISPEGAQGHTAGPASDVYSIATLLYQMLAGRTPFEGEQAVGLLVQQIHDAPPALRSIARSAYVPEPLAEVVMANLAKDPKARAEDARALGQAIFEAAKASGLAPEEISRPLHRRAAAALKLPPNERTKQLDLSPELAERLTPPSPKVNGAAPPAAVSGRERPISAATTKWEPPEEFQARLAEAMASEFDPKVADAIRPSTKVVAAAPAPAPRESKPRTPSGVDETLDDESAEPPPVPHSSPSAAAGASSVPRTLVGDPPEAARGSTQYATIPPGAVSAPRLTSDASADTVIREPPRRSWGTLFVVACFVVGALVAAVVAWRMGKLGGDDMEERYVQRAQDAMFKNRFLEPPGESVRDITDEGLRRYPGQRRLVDVRSRAASALVSQAISQRAAGDLAEALRLSKAARDLDPNDGAAKRLVEQYEAELANFAAPSAPPLTSAQPPAKPSSSSSATSFKVLLDVSSPVPKPGQTVELVARVLPAKGAFEGPTFTIANASGVATKLAAGSVVPGVFRASYAFGEAGRFEVSFTALADGKPLKASRTVFSADQPPAAPPSAPPPSTPPTAPTSSVKWM